MEDVNQALRSQGVDELDWGQTERQGGSRQLRDETKSEDPKMHVMLYTAHSQTIDGSRPNSLIRSIIHHIGVKYEISAPPSPLLTPEVSRPHIRP